MPVEFVNQAVFGKFPKAYIILHFEILFFVLF